MSGEVGECPKARCKMELDCEVRTGLTPRGWKLSRVATDEPDIPNTPRE